MLFIVLSMTLQEVVTTISDVVGGVIDVICDVIRCITSGVNTDVVIAFFHCPF